MAVMEAQHKIEYRKMKFAASLKGIDLDAQTGEDVGPAITNDSLADLMRKAEEEQGIASGTVRNNEFTELGLGLVKE